MVRVVNTPEPPGDAIQRAHPGDDGSPATTRPALTVVRSAAHRPHPHRGMWLDDPIADPTTFTQPDDWPGDLDFAPLIALARQAGDHLLAAQLEADRAFCAGAHARFEAKKRERETSSA